MKPIIFSSDSIRAILAGRKTQTRRVIKPQPASGIRKSPFVSSGIEDGHGRYIKLPYQPGDKLWVRETWARIYTDEEKEAFRIEYRADTNAPRPGGWPADEEEGPHWNSPRFMPKEAARLFLRVADVRVQRIQEISNTDCIREGVNNECCRVCIHTGGSGCDQCNALWMQYRNLWDKLNAKRGYGWESNPWVWAITFELLQDAQQVE